MEDIEALQMMNRCVHEIEQLRRERDALAPRAEAYGALLAVLNLLPQPSRGMSEDIVWALKKRIEALTPKPEAKPPRPAEREAD